MTMFDETTDPNRPIHPQAAIGHVHLKVADLERSIAFYRDAFGFELTGRVADRAAFLSAGGYHHHLGLNTFESLGGGSPAAGTTGLYHFAIRYPDRIALARALERLLDRGVQIAGASDHGATISIYLHDPDGNGIEITYDRDPAEWPRDETGALIPMLEPLDLVALLAELDRVPAEVG
jgi:catechol 2,3-dioxygenase